jgi:uncharacterized membrane protein
LKAEQVEDGLNHALEEASALLAQHFGMATAPTTVHGNELPDDPHLQ